MKNNYALVCMGVGILATATPALSAEVENYRSSGNYLQASQFSVSEDGCEVLHLFINADERVIRQKNEKISGSAFFINMFRDNFCTFEFSYMSGWGEGLDIDVSKGLETATVKGEIEIYMDGGGHGHDDSVIVPEPPAPMPFERIMVDLTWTGIGDISRGKNQFRDTYSSGEYFFSISSKSSGNHREASVSGSISGHSMMMNIEIGQSDSRDMFGDPGFASMGYSKDHFRTIVK